MNENETVNQEVATEEKTFTQAELDAIVGERLSRERAKYTDYEEVKAKAARLDEIEEANKSELQKAQEQRDALQAQLDQLMSAAELREIRAKVAEETGVPANLITGETEEECKAQAEAIAAYANPKSYPKVKDGGEVTHRMKPTTQQQFANWLEQTFK